MERRVLIAVFLSFLVLYAYQAIFIPAQPPQQSPAQATQPAAQPPAATIQPSAQTAPAPVPDVAGPAAVVTDTAAREIVVETATVRPTLTNRGARIVSWQLKEYRDAAGEPV